MKKRSKSILCIFAALLIACVSAAGCGQTAGGAKTPEATAAPAETKAPETSAAPAETKAPGTSSRPAETKAPEASSAPAETPSPGPASIEGIWYEQEEGGGVLTVTKDTLSYKHYDYTFDTEYRTGETTAEGLEILTDDEYWVYIDIFFDPQTETITGHDLPHTDGDGGYHLHTFKKTEYVAPPEPTYGPRTDRSDASAPKEFERSTIEFLIFSVIEPFRANGDMAPEQPEAGVYTYLLEAGDDGTYPLTSSFCDTIYVTEEQVNELLDLFYDSGIPSLNGVSIYTEDMPEDTAYYDLEIQFANGEHFASSANGRDISVIWDTDGFAFHQCLFNMFTDAGYNFMTREFHSTEPMLRVWYDENEEPAYTVTTELVRKDRKGEAYDYDVHTEYPVFTAKGDAPEALMKTLSELSDMYKEKALSDLEEIYSAMADVPKDIWKDADHRYAYSFYAPTRENSCRKNLFTLFVSEGHASSFDIGKYGYGYYPYWRFCIDTETGEVLSLSDFFTSVDDCLAAVTEALLRDYPYDEYKEYFTSDEYQEYLEDAITLPEHEGGIGVSPEYAHLSLTFPKELAKDRDYGMNIQLYYDAMQDILNERYAVER